MDSIPQNDAAQEKLDQLLQTQTSWVGEVGKSLERSEDHIKQRMQYFDRLAVLAGAILAFSIPAFTSFRATGRIITHNCASLDLAIAGWIFLFITVTGAIVTHYLLIENYSIWTSEHEGAVQSVLFHNINLSQNRLMRSAGGDLAGLYEVPLPTRSFQRKPWHEKLETCLTISSSTTVGSCLLGVASILLFLIFSSY